MVKKVRQIGKIRQKKINAIASKLSRMSYHNLSKEFIINSLVERNARTKTLDKIFLDLRSKKSQRQINAVFNINKPLTKKVKQDIRFGIRDYAREHNILVREAKLLKQSTFGGVIKMFDRTEFWQRANADLLGSEAWKFERRLAKREGRKLRTIEKQAADVFNVNKAAQKIDSMRKNEIDVRNELRLPIFRKVK